jgi:hypothetical protein
MSSLICRSHFLFPDIVEVIVAERQPRFWMLGALIAAHWVASGCLVSRPDTQSRSPASP